ncbi:MAG: hypothetical protein HOV87_18060 [Catenulispora sp.]|nr:hypothetical protein [Catenulispora sp.]
MSKLFGSEEEMGPEEKHRRAAESKKAEAGEHRPAAKKTAKAVPASRAHSHDDEPKRTSSPLHPTKSVATGNTLAHDQMLTVHILTHVPEHAPREDDPHYHLFEQAKARLKRQGMWKCIIDDDLCEGDPELHHTHVEFSQINQVDEKKIQQALGLHFETDEDFQKWAESPGNLEVLCANHHRAHYGIHVIPGPLWEALRFHKTGTGPAAEFVPADQVDDVKKDDDDAKPAAKKTAASRAKAAK